MPWLISPSWQSHGKETKCPKKETMTWHTSAQFINIPLCLLEWKRKVGHVGDYPHLKAVFLENMPPKCHRIWPARARVPCLRGRGRVPFLIGQRRGQRCPVIACLIVFLPHRIGVSWGTWWLSISEKNTLYLQRTRTVVVFSRHSVVFAKWIACSSSCLLE